MALHADKEPSNKAVHFPEGELFFVLMCSIFSNNTENFSLATFSFSMYNFSSNRILMNRSTLGNGFAP